MEIVESMGTPMNKRYWRKKDFYVPALVVLIIACSNVMIDEKWKVIHGRGIQGDNQSFEFLLSNNRSLLLFGTEIDNASLINKQFSRSAAMIYSSIDSGSNWAKKRIGEGRFTAIAAMGEDVYVAIRTKGSCGSASASSSATEIFHSNDFGKSWSMSTVLNSFFVKNMFYRNEGMVYMLGKKDEDAFWTVLNTNDTGRTWKDGGRLPNDMYSPALVNDDLYYLSHIDSGSIMRYSISTSKKGIIPLPGLNLKPYLLSPANGQLYLVGISNKKVSIYQYMKAEGEFKILTEINTKSSKFPLSVDIAGNKLVLLLGERNTIGATYSIYYRDLKTQRWSETDIPSSLFKPFCFNGQFVLGYSYDGEFYEMSLNDDR